MPGSDGWRATPGTSGIGFEPYRLVELTWQRQVIERWLDCAGISAESRAQLDEMLAQVNSELQALESSRSHSIGNNRVTPKQTG
jgi:hypothetical protein